ncbi:Uncharacterized protein HZ326_23585 [Fusarium oxysporum f. sp. albedinis]|nr:Uncharacterized protein HZ326_23585 [Fusarium oxysporum f. sp. albedinis]
MVQSMLPAEVVISIILGILQLIVGIISLWQQHYFRWAAHRNSQTWKKKKHLLRVEIKSQDPQDLTKFVYNSVWT